MSYVMQQNHRQGNYRSNVLTSSASLCPVEHLELLKWENIVLRKKTCFSADDHQDVCGDAVNITFSSDGGQWTFVNDSEADGGQQVRASNLWSSLRDLAWIVQIQATAKRTAAKLLILAPIRLACFSMTNDSHYEKLLRLNVDLVFVMPL